MALLVFIRLLLAYLWTRFYSLDVFCSNSMKFLILRKGRVDIPACFGGRTVKFGHTIQQLLQLGLCHYSLPFQNLRSLLYPHS